MSQARHTGKLDLTLPAPVIVDAGRTVLLRVAPVFWVLWWHGISPSSMV